MLDNAISNEAYHADVSALTSSMLKTLAITPAHFFDRYLSDREPTEPSRAMVRGTMIHCMVLEPNWFDDRNVVIPEGLDRRTKEGKALWAELQASGKNPITKQEYDDAIGAFTSVLSHPISKEIFSAEGLAETSIRWTNENGIDCKCRPDFMIPPNVCEKYPNGLILDLKTTATAEKDRFMKTAYTLKYHISAAHYCEGFEHEFGSRPDFLFCAIEPKRPYLSRYFKPSDLFMAQGQREVYWLIDLYLECKEAGKWPGYPETVDVLDLPSWAVAEDGEVEIEYAAE